MAAAAASKKLKQQQVQQQKQTLISQEESECLAELAKQFGITDLKLEDLKNPQSALMKLIRGERRQIQEEVIYIFFYKKNQFFC
jgi:(p)ppGpp synthase/HD superfamily hydrolase